MPYYIYVILLCEQLLIVFAFYLIFSWLTKTPFYPSSVKKLNRLIEEGKLIINEGDRFIDIGSGDGRFVIWAAKRNMYADGIEFNPFLTLLSRSKIVLNRVGNKARILNKNFNDHDYSGYDIAYLYIFTDHMDKIKDKLFKEMKPGSVIITNTFTFTDIEPDDVYDRFNLYYVK